MPNLAGDSADRRQSLAAQDGLFRGQEALRRIRAVAARCEADSYLAPDLAAAGRLVIAPTTPRLALPPNLDAQAG